VPLSPSSITWYRRRSGVNRHTTRYISPYSWPHSVSWCLAEGYRKRRSAPPMGTCGLGRTLLFYIITLRSLHWLPVKQRVDYKLATLVYKWLHSLPGRRLPADHGLWTPPALLRSRQRPHFSENKHSTWRQKFLGRGSENLEQSTRLTAAA